MLRLSLDEYDDAVETMAQALTRAEDAGMRTMAGRAMVMLEALGADHDVSVIDPGPRDDIESGNVWPEETEFELENRAIAAALAASPGPIFPKRLWK